MTSYALDDRDVVVVIGSGAGGGTLANELCQHGKKVVLLEAGPWLTADDYVNDEWAAFRHAVLAGQTHRLRQLARGQGSPQLSGLALQRGRRH